MSECEMIEQSAGFTDFVASVGWASISNRIALQTLRDKYPLADVEVVKVFEQLVDAARQYKIQTGRYLGVWGELGELYAEIKFGLQRHRMCAAGSDGRIGNDHVEVKTISPVKSKKNVFVKRSGNFNKLLVVKIDECLEFDAKMVDRKRLGKGTGKNISVSWSSLCE